MNAKLSGVQLPAGATVDIHIHVTAPLNITPFVAQQKVNVFTLMEISSQLLADTPELSVGERLCWSVPVLLTSRPGGSSGRSAKSSSMPRPGSCWWTTSSFRGCENDARQLAERSAL